MSNDDPNGLFPSVPDERQRPNSNRTVLGVLSLLLLAAVLLAVWYLVVDDDSGTAAESNSGVSTGPTPVTIPTSTPGPEPDPVVPSGTTGANTLPTPAAASQGPTTVPTPVPEGFEACGPDRAPVTTRSYIVDTTTTPLNQRAEPAVGAELAGTFPPGTTGLVFTGDCVVNLADGYVWWQIDNGTTAVWVASDFVSPN